MSSNGNPKALLPILVFVVLYLGLGITFEYVLDIGMGFYEVPVVVIFLIALAVACIQYKGTDTNGKFAIMGKGLSDPNIITMLLIFICAGIFVGTVGRSSAASVAYFLLDFIPPECAVMILFIVAAFVSLSMGTSVGTITLITPIAAQIALSTGFSPALCIGSVVGGAMFGDNLSFISDTTIAACNGQGCAMKDKFKENFRIAIPAAIVTAIVILVISFNSFSGSIAVEEYDLLKIVPYILVLIGGLIGLNVFVVMFIGIISGALIILGTSSLEFTDAFVSMTGDIGSGVAGMFETSMVAILVAAIGAIIAANGGFDAVLHFFRSKFKSNKQGMLGIGLLTAAMDVATANNTVAIIMANPIAKEMSQDYGISPKRTASLMDMFSCVMQGIIPYGAQLLVAVSAAASVGVAVSTIDIIPNLFYPFALLISALVFIFIIPSKKDESGQTA